MLKEMTLLAPQSRAFTTVLGRAVLAQATQHTYWSLSCGDLGPKGCLKVVVDWCVGEKYYDEWGVDVFVFSG